MYWQYFNEVPITYYFNWKNIPFVISYCKLKLSIMDFIKEKKQDQFLQTTLTSVEFQLPLPY